jgi:hypothetical protein
MGRIYRNIVDQLSSLIYFIISRSTVLASVTDPVFSGPVCTVSVLVVSDLNLAWKMPEPSNGRRQVL